MSSEEKGGGCRAETPSAGGGRGGDPALAGLLLPHAAGSFVLPARRVQRRHLALPAAILAASSRDGLCEQAVDISSSSPDARVQLRAGPSSRRGGKTPP